MKSKTNLIRLVYISLVAALVCIATLIYVPLPIGYANLGDAIILMAGFILGPVAGGLAGGVGAALADLFAGYPAYIPATFVIKLLVAVIAALIYRSIISGKKRGLFARIIAAVVAEAFMVLGYYLYEATALSYGFGGALASVGGNLTQALVCAAVAVVALPAVQKIYEKIKK